ncbi:MAG: HAD family phosphatase [Chitinophagaceae bacterium]|nr:HAD family phosphatase [Chitinophagaceae bacterium]
MAIKNIIFDLGGVLLNLDINKTLDAYKAIGLNNIRDLFGIGHADSFFKKYETGHLNDDGFIDSILTLEGNTGTAQQITEAWNAMLLDFPPERVEWLKQLKSTYRLFLFSNTNAIHLRSFQTAFQELYGFHMDELFERAYYSHVAGLRKPDAAAYQLVLDDNKLIAQETVFIDDALVNIEAANSVGIHGIHLQAGHSVTSLQFDAL